MGRGSLLPKDYTISSVCPIELTNSKCKCIIRIQHIPKLLLTDIVVTVDAKGQKRYFRVESINYMYDTISEINGKDELKCKSIEEIENLICNSIFMFANDYETEYANIIACNC